MGNIKKLAVVLLTALAAAAVARCEDYATQAIGPFGNLNNTDSSFVIPADKAQDLLNVDISPNGKSVKKRKGFSLFSNLAITTSAVHGVYNFYDSNGNDVSLFFNDAYMMASVAGGAATTLFSNGPNGATYQCVDSQGFAYCANTNRTTIIKTNGATYSTLAPVATGYLIAVTPDRLVMAGSASSQFPNRIDFSKANDFTTWVVGSQPTDPVNFTITAPGSRITHITYAFNRLMWFKDSSFGYILSGPTLGDWQVRTVSPNVGTLDNSSVYWDGLLYFRGQDAHFYVFDGSSLQKLSRDIQATVSNSQTRSANSWTQTTAADFNTGSVPVDIDSTTVSGSLVAKTTSYVQTTQSDWNAATYDTTLFVDTQTSSGSLQTAFPETCDSIRDGNSSTNRIWYSYGGSGSISSSSASGVCTYTYSGSASQIDLVSVQKLGQITTSGTTFYMQPQNNFVSGGSLSTYFGIFNNPAPLNVAGGVSGDKFIYLEMLSTSTTHFEVQRVVYKPTGTTTLTIPWSDGTGGMSSSDAAFGTYGTPVLLYVTSTAWAFYFNGVMISSGTHTLNTTGGFYVGVESSWNGSSAKVAFDNFTIVPQTFTFTSKSLDTGIVSPVWAPFTATTSGSGSFSFTSQVSADNSTFDSAVTATSGSNLASAPKRYAKINAAFNYNPTSLPGTPTALADFTVTAGSSGTFQSAVKNASSLTAWDTFLATKLDNGGTHTFAIRSATGAFSVSSSTPTNWTTVVAGAVPTVSTGTYFQIRDIISSTCSTCTPTLNDFTQNWFEGAATDKAYGVYHRDAIWWAVASGSGATSNNKIARFDLLTPGWTLYDIPMNGMLVRNQSLYFGSASTGKVYKFGDTDNDDGAAINAYWKSKDFFGDNPFTDKEIVSVSAIGTSVANSSMTVTYTLNASSSTAYTVPLYTSSSNFIRSNKNVQAGRVGNTLSIKFGNNAADQPFEIYAVQFGYRPRPWTTP